MHSQAAQTPRATPMPLRPQKARIEMAALVSCPVPACLAQPAAPAPPPSDTSAKHRRGDQVQRRGADVAAVVGRLQKLGFREEDALRAVQSGGGAVSLPDSVDWLCVHLPEEHLPARYAAGGPARRPACNSSSMPRSGSGLWMLSTCCAETTRKALLPQPTIDLLRIAANFLQVTYDMAIITKTDDADCH